MTVQYHATSTKRSKKTDCASFSTRSIRLQPRGTRQQNFYRKLSLAAATWLVFLLTWLGTAYVLFLVEKPVEYKDQKKYDERYYGLLLNASQDDNFQNDLASFLDWMVEHGDCTIGDKDNLNWTFWGAAFFLLNIATTIGYGNFSHSESRGRFITIVYALISLPCFALVHVTPFAQSCKPSFVCTVLFFSCASSLF